MHTPKGAAIVVVVSILVLGGVCVVGDGLRSVDVPLPIRTAASPILVPLARAYHTMAYDAESDRVVLFGGDVDVMSLVNDTWSYDFNSNTWAPMHPNPYPSARESAGAAYNAASDRLVLFGGYAFGDRNETWSYDLNTNTWVLKHPASAPSERHYLPLAYDSAADSIVLFGGLFSAPFNDTWTYDLASDTWTNQDPTVHPSARAQHAMAYSSRADKVVLFGGLTMTPTGQEIRNNDTWAYDLTTNTWTRMNPARAPSPRWYPSMAYDPKADRFVLFGGFTQTGYSAETWSYDLNTDTWTPMNPANPPSGREIPGLVYDSRADRFVLFGGMTSGRPNGETWAYDYGNNTWTLRIPEQAPGSPGNPHAIAGNGWITLFWQAPASPGSVGVTSYRVYRGTSSGSESLLMSGWGNLAYTDTTVAHGETYYYQVAAVNAIGEGVKSTEVSAAWADTTPPILTITEPANNSAYGHMTLTLTGTALDDVAVAKVEISLDGVTWITATGTTSWSATVTLVPGGNTIYVRATDTWGNTALSTIHVEVDVPPPLTIPIWVWPVVAAGIAAAAAAAYVVLRRRRKPATAAEPPPP